MSTNTVFNRYTHGTYEYVIGLARDFYDGYEIAIALRFSVGRVTGEVIGLKDIPWAVRQNLHDNYGISL